MAVAHLSADDYRRAPWRNGLGVSREVARAEDGSGGARWLVSLTTIAADCPFSDYRGYDRVLTPLGDGVLLAVGDAAPVQLAKLRPFAFSGDDRVECRLAAGPTDVINAMVARDWGSQSVTLLQAVQARFAIASPIAVLHAPGAATVTIAGAAYSLAPGDSLHLDDMAGSDIAAASETPLYLATFRPHR
jgi:environmental stress-induced protein Ves